MVGSSFAAGELKFHDHVHDLGSQTAMVLRCIDFLREKKKKKRLTLRFSLSVFFPLHPHKSFVLRGFVVSSRLSVKEFTSLSVLQACDPRSLLHFSSTSQ